MKKILLTTLSLLTLVSAPSFAGDPLRDVHKYVQDFSHGAQDKKNIEVKGKGFMKAVNTAKKAEQDKKNDEAGRTQYEFDTKNYQRHMDELQKHEREVSAALEKNNTEVAFANTNFGKDDQRTKDAYKFRTQLLAKQEELRDAIQAGRELLKEEKRY